MRSEGLEACNLISVQVDDRCSTAGQCFVRSQQVHHVGELPARGFQNRNCSSLPHQLLVCCKFSDTFPSMVVADAKSTLEVTLASSTLNSSFSLQHASDSDRLRNHIPHLQNFGLH